MSPAGGKRRVYGQYCGVAYALDLIGERWTLLIVRDLLLGPRRYSDLFDGLPGVATNLLSQRLRHLEEHHLIERVGLPRPAGGVAYQLTAEGQRLMPVVIALGRFGGKYLPARPDDAELFRPRLAVTGLAQTFRTSRAVAVTRTYLVVLDHEFYEVRVDDGRLTTRQQVPSRPDVTIEGSAGALMETLSGRIGPREAIDNEVLDVKVDPEAISRDARDELALFVELFGWNVSASDGAVEMAGG